MSRNTKSQIQQDANYVKDMRWRLERAHARIDTMTLQLNQYKTENNLLTEALESLNKKYTELERRNNMSSNKAINIALTKLREAQEEIYAVEPPPYPYPSTAGRVAQLIADSINTIEIIRKKADNPES